MDRKNFHPFYERLPLSRLTPIIEKLLFSIILGLAFLTTQYLSIGSEAFKDWNWFLSVLISTAMLFLYYSTHTLRSILPEMTRLGSNSDQAYMPSLRRLLADRCFVLAGLFFGLLNCGFGFAFGLPYSKGLALLTILGGYFLAGFVCGMAVWGICGTCVILRTYCRNAKLNFDFTSPDRCGGTLFLGEALVVFSLVTLIVGVMISVYILKADWTRPNTWWVSSLKLMWVAFPYVMALTALIFPAVPINQALRAYKKKEEDAIQIRLTGIRTRLESGHLEAAERKESREDYEFQIRIRNDLRSMRTWPVALGADLKYLVVFGSNLLVSGGSVSEWIKKHPLGFGG